MMTKGDEPGPSLAQQLDEHRNKSRAKFPPEVVAIMQKAAEELLRSGTAERCLREGAPAPEFALPNVRGDMVALSALLARGPVVLAFYRGGW